MTHSARGKSWLRSALKSGAVTTALIAGMSFPAIAQDEQPPADETEDLIIVTGSKIPRKDLISASPVSVFDEQTVDITGKLSVGRMLRRIPSVAGGAQTTSINNGGGGTEEISVRGLGAERTLVLVNGRRVPDSSGSLTGQVDLNTIPVSMIERVEVLKDGASTVYGSDAVAGVVNIILKEDFEGFELSYQGGISDKGDGQQHQYSATFGHVFDGGNFVINLTKAEQDPIVARDREWAETAVGILFGEVIPQGSSAPPWGRYFVSGGPASSVTLGPDFSGGGFFGFRGYNGATDTYNFAPVNFQTQPVDRFAATFSGNMDIKFLTGKDFFVKTEAFALVSYVDRESQQALAEVPLAPFAFFGFDAPYSEDNAYNPFGQDIQDWRRRMVEGGTRNGFNDTRTFRLITGLKGELRGGWLWEFNYIYGDVDQSTDFGPVINLEKTAQAVGPTALDGDGQLRCDTNGDGNFDDDDNAACVPLNVFGQNSITQDMLDFIAFTQHEQTFASSEIFSFDLVNPEVMTLPAGPVGIALGYVHRQERGAFEPDGLVAALADAATGTPAQPTAGGYDLDEGFFEIRIPVLANLQMVHSLDIEGGVRYSNYSTFGDTTNWSVGALFRPVEDLLLRGRVNTAFRAPQIFELFGGQGFSFPGVTDPCASNPTPNCIADGVPVGGFTQISSQVRTVVGGNEDLQPETADIWTAGFVFTPSAVPGLEIGADYWSYKLTDPITSIGADVILSQCAATGDFCDLVDRITDPGPSQGAPILIDDRTANVGRIDAAGVDFFAQYSGLEVGPATLAFKVDGTYYDKYDLEQANGLVVPHAGFLRDDNDGLFAKWRLAFRTIVNIDRFLAAFHFRYIDGVTEFGEDLVGSCVDEFGNEDIPGVNAGLTCVTADSEHAEVNLGDFQREIEQVWYLDVHFAYNMPTFEGIEAQVYFGIDNVLDEEPPLSVDGFNDNTDVRTYDTTGRFFYGGIRATF